MLMQDLALSARVQQLLSLTGLLLLGCWWMSEDDSSLTHGQCRSVSYFTETESCSRIILIFLLLDCLSLQDGLQHLWAVLLAGGVATHHDAHGKQGSVFAMVYAVTLSLALLCA